MKPSGKRKSLEPGALGQPPGEPPTGGKMLVVVGSSAGGIEALKVLVATLKPDFPAPVVLAQHLDPNRLSNLGEILERCTTMPVKKAEGRTRLEPGTIYVIPANHQVAVTDGSIEFQDEHKGRPRPSVDLLLSSAAAVYGDRLVAVILTGSGSDGAVGAVDVKDGGGTVVVQNPASARYPSMPLALPPTVVDHVVDLEKIGPLLYDLTRLLSLGETQERGEDALRPILEIVGKQTNIDFRPYKSSTILRRIARRMSLAHCDTLQDYAAYLQAHREEVAELVMALLIKVTEFFRDQEAFEYIREHILPELIEKGRRHGRVLRLWSAGCATGEEPYSLALLIADMLGAELSEWNVKIFATDLDEGAISFARRGIYPHNVLKKVPADLRVRFFDTIDHGLQITKPLRQLVIFGLQDISRGVPFPRIDLAICRNLLIYFKPELQQVVLDLFAYSLQHSKGYLFLGKAETARPSSANYEQIDKRWKVYRCINGPLPGMSRHTASSPRNHVLVPPRGEIARPVAERAMVSATVVDAVDADISQLRRFNELLLRSLPIGVVVIDQAYRILSINSAARRLLGIRELAFEHDFLHSARCLPYAMVRNAIDAVIREKNPATLAEVPLEPPPTSGTRWLSLTLMPAQSEASLSDLIVISVVDTTDQIITRRRLETTQQEQAQLLAELSNANKRLNEVNKELQDANEELQATNEEMTLTQEELQATNEELEATNEELQATNEELETNNEELQATNEELQTTNEELGARTHELQDLTRTLSAERKRLGEMVELAPFAIMVLRGPGLVLEAVNPSFARLIESKDVLGFTLEAVFRGPAWSPLVATVRDAYWNDTPRVTPRLRAARLDAEGASREAFYQYTIVPTHENGGSVSGIVVYAEDVSAQVSREADEVRAQFKLMIEHSEPMALALYDAHTAQLLQASPRYVALLRNLRGSENEDLVGQHGGDAPPLAGQSDAERLYRAAVEARAPQRLSELRLQIDGRETVWDVTFVPLLTREEGAGLVQFVVVAAFEVTESVRAREEAERLDRLKGEFLSHASHELRTPLAAMAAYASLLLAMAKEGADDPRVTLAKVGEYVQKCSRMIQHLNRLVDDLLDVARLENGKFTLKRGTLDVVDFVARFVESMRPLVVRPPLRCELPEGGAGLFVFGDEGRLRQVLTNLVDNAAQYAGDGESIDVSVRGVSGEDCVEVAVRDHGPGIPVEQREAVFQPFHQVGRATRSERPGLGLGLYMCRQIVQQHDGTITLESTPGEGSTFRIRLPMIEG
jgi:two-component system CheB/CheR fusion protein